MAEIFLYSPIEDGAAERFITELRATRGPVTVRINSPGGIVAEGMAIANAIRGHREPVTTINDAMAASIASAILCAGRRVLVTENSMTMVHAPWSMSVGTADDHRKSGETLDKFCEALRLAYKRTGKSDAELDAIFAEEVWYSATEAVAHGYADEIVDALAIAASLQRFDLSKFRHAPEAQSTMTTEILAREQSRRTDIRGRFGRFAESHRVLLDECLDDVQCTPQAAADKLLDRIGAGAEPLRSPFAAPHNGAGFRAADFVAAASDALAIRAGVRLARPHPGASDLAQASVVDMARTCLSQEGRPSPGFSSRPAIIKAAMSTSDFPLLLGDSIGKILRNGYESEPASHRAWVRVSDVPDFKVQSRVGLGSAPDLTAIPELGEYTFGSLSEERETFFVTKYGKALALSWEALVNDDLQVFGQVPRMFAQAARRKEADVIYTDLLAANAGAGQTMFDSVALFHADHGNLVGSAAFDATQLSLGRVKLRRQTAIGGGLLNLEPRYLIVPPEKETAAEALISSMSRLVATTAEAAPAQWLSSLQLVVEPRVATTAVYLVANTAQIDCAELGILADQGGAPFVENESDFNTDALFWKVRHVFGGRFIDYRGIVKLVVT